MIRCTFAGHREVLVKGVKEQVEAALAMIMSGGSSFEFYAGGMGEFDRICANAVRKMKREQPEKQIRLFLVCPYMTTRINRDGAILHELYDDIIVLDELADCHYKSAITKRNRWMVEQSDIILAFVQRDYGGAYTTKKYAEKKGITVVEIAGDSNS
jgi:uncharacterized phage-like protein YoqJ